MYTFSIHTDYIPSFENIDEVEIATIKVYPLVYFGIISSL